MLNTIKHQKQVADKVLAAIESFDLTCVVAGGAPRDWYLGRQATDIDLFFHYRPRASAKEVKMLLERALDVSVNRLGADNFSEEYKVNKDLKTVWQTEVDGVVVQFMEMVKPTWGVVDHFPLSICKAWYKKGKIFISSDFKKSLESKVIFKTNPIYMDSSRYLKKILSKFPEYTYYESYEDYLKGDNYG